MAENLIPFEASQLQQMTADASQMTAWIDHKHQTWQVVIEVVVMGLLKRDCGSG